ncbi:hypothetical protein [Gymnodinialimonas ceratoperidinii]|uniref:Transmembrane protein n=1 Tax=Gymnodinialimonas ceratoperidinii TaxID=2856823 RepID=A0A8F6TUE7_9RHOB|nr:hypothetical protein [Gymnodinialimonas ceratoperidinii]QXT38900.1 hypothetical protein KYE46_13280 [Gymnodinialimonas ceratoperidinii]
MTFNEAVALQPMWVQIWLNVLFAGAFVLPLGFLIWRESRLAGVLTLGASVLAALATTWMYGQMGYVKLLGLPHIILWTPLAVYLWRQIRRADMPLWPRRLMSVTLVIIVISLLFDYADVARWILGERAPMAGTLAAE